MTTTLVSLNERQQIAADLFGEANIVAWPDDPEWYLKRPHSIGASEIAAVAGLDPYRTALEIYLSKTGQSAEFEGNRATRVGTRLEPLIVDEFCKEHGQEVALYPCPMVRHSEYAFATATPDAVLASRELLEAKAVSLRALKNWGPEGTDEAPPNYVVQCQWQMSCTGFDICRLVPLIAADELRVYTIERNERFIELLLGLASEFWARVESRTPPEPDLSHPRTPELLRSLYSTVADSEVIDLSPEAREAWVRYESLGKEAGEIESERKELKSLVQVEIGEHLGGDLGDGRFVKRIQVKRPEYTVPESSHIQLRACKKGKL